MKFLFLILLIAVLLWIISIAWSSRRKSPYDNSSGGNSGSGYSTSSCASHDGGCGGGDGGCGGD